MLQNEYVLAKVGFDTAENEPCKVCPLSLCGEQPECMDLSAIKVSPRQRAAQPAMGRSGSAPLITTLSNVRKRRASCLVVLTPSGTAILDRIPVDSENG